MEWYTLDSTFKKQAVIEGFASMIWTERYNVWGDFEITTISTPETRSLLALGTNISKEGSQYVMTIETITDSYDDTGARMLDITGRSLERILDDRIGMPIPLVNLTTTPTWNLGPAVPGAIARAMFAAICVSGDTKDIIPALHSGTLNPAGSITEPTTSLTLNLSPDTLYNDLSALCQAWNLGFRLIKDGDTGNLYFEVYVGDDRTTDQTTRAPVVFSDSLGNLGDATFLKSSAIIKTVAHVFNANGVATVYADGVDQNANGFDRRVLYVDASDLDLAAGTPLQNLLTIRGQQALLAQQTVYQFAGQTTDGGYVYGVDYKLGDLVEERDSDGLGNQMIVTEQIFVSDNEGERSYPTLTVSNIIIPGTWISEPATLLWSTAPGTEVWSNAT